MSHTKPTGTKVTRQGLGVSAIGKAIRRCDRADDRALFEALLEKWITRGVEYGRYYAVVHSANSTKMAYIFIDYEKNLKRKYSCQVHVGLADQYLTSFITGEALR